MNLLLNISDDKRQSKIKGSLSLVFLSLLRLLLTRLAFQPNATIFAISPPFNRAHSSLSEFPSLQCGEDFVLRRRGHRNAHGQYATVN